MPMAKVGNMGGKLCNAETPMWHQVQQGDALLFWFGTYTHTVMHIEGGCNMHSQRRGHVLSPPVGTRRTYSSVSGLWSPVAYVVSGKHGYTRTCPLLRQVHSPHHVRSVKECTVSGKHGIHKDIHALFTCISSRTLSSITGAVSKSIWVSGVQ